MEKVFIEKCGSYDYEEVRKAVFKCLDGIESIKARAAGNPRVLVKVNLLKRNKPEDAVTTHPAVAHAIVEYLQQLGCRPVLGDSPAGPYMEKNVMGVYKVSGMAEVARVTGCELATGTGTVEVENTGALMLKHMQIIKIAADVDFVVSAAKMKTHGMMTYTGAVKNLFGVIPGLIKAEYHFKMNDERNFAHHLLDICEYIKPAFSVIDAVEAMEGDGPSAGEKRHAGLIMAAENPHAIDTAAVHIMGINPMSVPTLKAAAERGIFSGKIKDIQAVGIAFEDISLAPFKLPASLNVNFIQGKVPKFLESFALNTLRAKPVFDHNMCISCGDCKRSCPAGIIDMSSGKPVPDLSKCISCFCCHEVCPKKAVSIKKHWLQKLLYR